MGLPFVLAADGKITRGRSEDREEEERWSHLP
jgi:hypothetical protein